ncbi:MAG: hypothetical protein RR101_12605 [Burkholderiaceae bacterium]
MDELRRHLTDSIFPARQKSRAAYERLSALASATAWCSLNPIRCHFDRENVMRSNAARLVSVLLSLPLAVFAQTTIYKVQLPDGSIGFTDKPPANAKILESREPGRNVNVIPSPAKPSAIERNSSSSSAANAFDTAHDEVIAATQALEDAKQRQADGRETLPGERIGLAGGGTRVSPAFEARQKSLAEAVAAAEERLTQAYQARNAAR